MSENQLPKLEIPQSISEGIKSGNPNPIELIEFLLQTEKDTVEEYRKHIGELQCIDHILKDEEEHVELLEDELAHKDRISEGNFSMLPLMLADMLGASIIGGLLGYSELQKAKYFRSLNKQMEGNKGKTKKGGDFAAFTGEDAVIVDIPKDILNKVGSAFNHAAKTGKQLDSTAIHKEVNELMKPKVNEAIKSELFRTKGELKDAKEQIPDNVGESLKQTWDMLPTPAKIAIGAGGGALALLGAGAAGAKLAKKARERKDRKMREMSYRTLGFSQGDFNIADTMKTAWDSLDSLPLPTKIALGVLGGTAGVGVGTAAGLAHRNRELQAQKIALQNQLQARRSRKSPEFSQRDFADNSSSMDNMMQMMMAMKMMDKMTKEEKEAKSKSQLKNLGKIAFGAGVGLGALDILTNGGVQSKVSDWKDLSKMKTEKKKADLQRQIDEAKNGKSGQSQASGDTFNISFYDSTNPPQGGKKGKLQAGNNNQTVKPQGGAKKGQPKAGGNGQVVQPQAVPAGQLGAQLGAIIKGALNGGNGAPGNP